MHVRIASMKDVPHIVELFHARFPEHDMYNEIASIVNDRCSFAAYDPENKRFIGYALAFYVDQDIQPPFHYNRATLPMGVFIYDVAIHPMYRGHGYTAELMTTIVDHYTCFGTISSIGVVAPLSRVMSWKQEGFVEVPWNEDPQLVYMRLHIDT